MSDRTFLEEIHIKNIGVITQANLEFDKGLTVLTGETGAGKTMVLTALNLVLGGKSESSLVRSGEERLTASALFSIPNKSIAEFENLGIEIEEGALAISRSVTKEGKSKAIASGVSINAGTLAEASDFLIEIHGQSSGLNITKGSRQRELLDRFAGVPFESILLKYQEQLSQYQQIKNRINDLKKSAASREESLSSLRLFSESFTKLKPQSNELSSVEEEIMKLSFVEELRVSVTHAINSLEHDDSGVVNAIGQAKKSLESVRDKDAKLDKFVDDLNDAFFVLADLLPNLTSYLQSLEADPERLDFLQERKASLAAFIKKWDSEVSGDSGLNVLIEKYRGVSSQLDDLSGGDERIKLLERDLVDIKKELLTSAKNLTESRTIAANTLSLEVSTEMHALSMPHTNLRIEIVSPDYGSGLKESDFTIFGCDSVNMYLQTHLDGPLVSLAKGASGGEMSRVMLALEVVLAASNPVGTYIFDEVDAGVGGAAAIEVGRRLHALSKNAQVIVVTHLPQVAAWGDMHYVVEKSVDGTVVSSGVNRVDGDERIIEIARMLAGLQESSSAKEHASELLSMRKKA
ncbi:MAG: DNA repair protein RecN [Actinobacteria bacterium]|uniref:DNA repair protein RecN n=1 Tax=freshwater metagenome TaxID=449393 RepID=A0A6J6TVV8_9ZZZZ|nr:DNA repair protein RecN [Actinomycetota bacterium]